MPGLVAPNAAVSKADKIAFFYRAKERMRLWYNSELRDRNGAWKREVFIPKEKVVLASLNEIRQFGNILPGTLGYDEQSTLLGAEKVAGQGDRSWDQWIDPEKIESGGVKKELPDPLENFTTYTEWDPGDDISIASDQITWATLLSNSNSLVAKSYGVSHFDSDFQHDFISKCTAESGASQVHIWMVSSVLDTWFDIYNANGHYLALYYYTAGGPTYEFTLIEIENNKVLTTDKWQFRVVNTEYGFEAERDISVGPNGTAYTRIYEGVTLKDTLTNALGAHYDYEYVHFTNTDDNGGGTSRSGYVKDADLREVAAVALSSSINNRSIIRKNGPSFLGGSVIRGTR